MKLSSRGEYGLAIMLGLAKLSDKKTISLRRLSKAENIPAAFAEQIAASLKKGKLIRSVRGSRGGYQLVRPASEISVGEVIRALDEDRLVPCLGPDGHCPRQNACATKAVWNSVRLSLYRSMDKIKLNDLNAKPGKKSK